MTLENFNERFADTRYELAVHLNRQETLIIDFKYDDDFRYLPKLIVYKYGGKELEILPEYLEDDCLFTEQELEIINEAIEQELEDIYSNEETIGYEAPSNYFIT